MIAGLCRLYTLFLGAFLLLRLFFADRWWYALPADFTPFLFVPLIVLAICALLVRKRGAFLFALPILLIGFGWYGRYFVPKPMQTTTSPLLIVATANVRYDNRTPERLAEWVRETDPDVVFLQEVTPEFRTTTLESLRDEYPFQTDVDRIGAGEFATLSKYPFSESALGNQFERHVIEFDGQPIALYNFHAPLPIGHRPHIPLFPNHLFARVFLNYDSGGRDYYIDLLRERASRETIPYIIGGDFNMSDHAAMYGQLSAQFGDSFRETGTGFGYSYPSPEYYDLPAFFPSAVRIDYLWHSSQFQTMSAALGAFTGSDHLPLVASFTLTP